MRTNTVRLRYGSMCSGIESTSVAWMPLGLLPAWFAEIDPFANAVLNHHYREVPNLGDMNLVADQILSGTTSAPDILVAGTPCQSFSTIGRRGGLADPRGALSLTYAEIANVIDQVRAERQEPEVILVWENVPGVLSDRSNAFGSILGALAGECCALQPSRHQWSNAGCVYGPQRSVAWRTLDAQYFGLAQRRKRVFVVASAREDFDPVEVLFESNGLRRDSPPSNESSGETSYTTSKNSSLTIESPDCHATPEGYKAPLTTVVQVPSARVAHTLTARGEAGTGRGTPILTMRFQCTASDLPGGFRPHAFAFAQNSQGEIRLESASGQVTGALSGGGGKPGQGFPAIAESPEPLSDTHLELTHMSLSQARRQNWAQWRIRRLMPVECERLQGLPDNYTLVPYRGRPAADGLRYRAIGQSMATYCMTWIGRRICLSLQTQSGSDAIESQGRKTSRFQD